MNTLNNYPPAQSGKKPDKPIPKPESIQSWENEGGIIIPTGQLPAVKVGNLPTKQDPDHQSKPILDNNSEEKI